MTAAVVVGAGAGVAGAAGAGVFRNLPRSKCLERSVPSAMSCSSSRRCCRLGVGRAAASAASASSTTSAQPAARGTDHSLPRTASVLGAVALHGSVNPVGLLMLKPGP